MSKLTARFEMSRKEAAYVLDHMHQPAEVEIETTRETAQFCWVSGEPQQLMFFIGEVAAHGWDTLSSVSCGTH